ncbi:hypothetical protein QR680_018188 [Steinernema hermaphroditum]|uniref:Uncharacterized protein n=1 Tax=Steinernema hermaphroditum TaxID=289476 RepID=A0AA39HJ88_9BILA|nr:hypothetical protein QR680_018188 [Steinernema hermaphroditum]
MSLIAYNDQPPGETPDVRYAHVKGFLGWRKHVLGGFHVLHTFPNFPNFKSDDFYESVGKEERRSKGQIFFCTTHNYDVLKDLWKMVKHTIPYVYHTHDVDENDFDTEDTPWSQTDASEHVQSTVVKTSGDQILRFLDRPDEAYFLAHSWTASPAKSRQPTICIPQKGCVLLIWEHNLGGPETATSTRSSDHSKFAAEVRIAAKDEMKKYDHEPSVFFSGSNSADTQTLRGGRALGIADAVLNEIFRCSVIYADFDTNGHLDISVDQLGKYFNERREVIFDAVCEGCRSSSACATTFGAENYSMEQMIEDTKRVSHGYYSKIENYDSPLNAKAREKQKEKKPAPRKSTRQKPTKKSK